MDSINQPNGNLVKLVSKGFTIVELLIVIVVIGILAAIVIVAYNGVQDRARVSSVKSDLANARKSLMVYNVDNGTYPASTAELTSAKVTISAANNYEVRSGFSNYYYCFDIANNDFAIGVRAASSSTASFYVTSKDGVTPYTGVISQSITCSLLGLSGTGAAQGAFSTSGFNTTGVPYSWLKVGS